MINIYRNTGEWERKLYKILTTAVEKDMDGHSVIKLSKLANHLAAYYIGRDFLLWNYSSDEERMKMIDGFYKTHKRIGINPRGNPIHNPGDALRELREIYLSWDLERLETVYNNVKERVSKRFLKETIEPKCVTDSRGQGVLVFK